MEASQVSSIIKKPPLMCPVDFNDYSNNYRNALKSSLGLFGGLSDFFHPYKIYCINKSIAKKRVKSILDFGCGEGILTGLLAHEFKEADVFGYDVAHRLLESARAYNYNLNNVIFSSSFPENMKFDLIIAANVFHHINVQEHIGVLSKLGKALSENASIIVFEHNPFNPLTRYIVKSCPFDKDAILIYCNNFARIVELCGLKVKKKKYILYFPWQLRIFRIIEHLLCRFPMGAQYMIEFGN